MEWGAGTKGGFSTAKGAKGAKGGKERRRAAVCAETVWAGKGILAQRRRGAEQGEAGENGVEGEWGDAAWFTAAGAEGRSKAETREWGTVVGGCGWWEWGMPLGDGATRGYGSCGEGP